MPSMEELLRACDSWTTPCEASEMFGGQPKPLANQLRLAVRRGWAESRFSDGRGTEYRALPGWEAMMERRERAPVPPRASPVKDAVLRALEAGPMTARGVAEAIGHDPRAVTSRLYSMALQGLVEPTPAGPRRVVYTLKKTAYSQEDPGMGDKDKDKSKPPYPSKEAEECENDTRNEP